VSITLVLTGPSGPVLGESVSTHHPNAIDVTSYSIGFVNPVTIGSATGGAGAGKVSLGELAISKPVDRSSPILFTALASGAHYNSADLYVENLDGVEIARIHLNTVFVSSEQEATSGERPVDSVSFVYGSVFWTYNVLNSDGTVASTTSGGWDQVRNISCPNPTC
jgi:type VI secretion system secreted protein Hcp